MSSFKKKCDFCGQEIQLSNDSGRWLPRNLDNSPHECKGKQSQSQPQPQQQQPPKQEQPQQSEQAKTVWTVFEEYNKRIQRIEKTLYGNQ